MTARLDLTKINTPSNNLFFHSPKTQRLHPLNLSKKSYTWFFPESKRPVLYTCNWDPEVKDLLEKIGTRRAVFWANHLKAEGLVVISRREWFGDWSRSRREWGRKRGETRTSTQEDITCVARPPPNTTTRQNQSEIGQDYMEDLCASGWYYI